MPCFSTWVAMLAKKIMEKTNAAIPILYSASISELKIARNEININAIVRIC